MLYNYNSEHQASLFCTYYALNFSQFLILIRNNLFGNLYFMTALFQITTQATATRLHYSLNIRKVLCTRLIT